MKNFFSDSIPENETNPVFDRPVIQEAFYILKNGFKDTSQFRVEFEGFTVDSNGSRELDDGLRVIKTSYGYEVFISVSDVGEYIKFGTKLDKEAFLRAEKTHGTNIFPPVIARNLLSLNEGETRLSLTIKIELDKDFQTLDFKVYESSFLNISAYDFNGFKKSLIDDFSRYHGDLQNMYELANGLKYKRFTPEGINSFDFPSQNSRENVSSFVLSQISVLANIELAKFFIKNKIEGIFRNHIPDFPDLSISGKTKPYYSNNMMYHSGLNTGPYMHFKAPMRRYPDLVNARQLKSFLRKDHYLYDLEDLLNIAIYTNLKVSNILNSNNND